MYCAHERVNLKIPRTLHLYFAFVSILDGQVAVSYTSLDVAVPGTLFNGDACLAPTILTAKSS